MADKCPPCGRWDPDVLGEVVDGFGLWRRGSVTPVRGVWDGED